MERLVVARFDRQTDLNRPADDFKRFGNQERIAPKFEMDGVPIETHRSGWIYDFQVSIDETYPNEVSTIVRRQGGRLLDQPDPPVPY